jgi:hypothetical protein
MTPLRISDGPVITHSVFQRSLEAGAFSRGNVSPGALLAAMADRLSLEQRLAELAAAARATAERLPPGEERDATEVNEPTVERYPRKRHRPELAPHTCNQPALFKFGTRFSLPETGAPKRA